MKRLSVADSGKNQILEGIFVAIHDILLVILPRLKFLKVYDVSEGLSLLAFMMGERVQQTHKYKKFENNWPAQ